MSPNSSTPADWGRYVEETFKTSNSESQMSYSTSGVGNTPTEPLRKKRKCIAGDEATESIPEAETSWKHYGSDGKLNGHSKTVIATKRHQSVVSPSTKERLELFDSMIDHPSDGYDSDKPDTMMDHDSVASPADSFKPSDPPSDDSTSLPSLQYNARRPVLSDDSDSDEHTTQVGKNGDFGAEEDLPHYAPTTPPSKFLTPGPLPISPVMALSSPIVPAGTTTSSLNGDQDQELFEAERRTWAEEFAKLTVERVRLETKARAAERHMTEALEREREKWSQERTKWEADRIQWECERKKWSVERTMMIERRDALLTLMKTSLEGQMKAIDEYVLCGAAPGHPGLTTELQHHQPALIVSGRLF
ncbi:hypothetical protein BDR06DRAFT_975130 [Suillus hirtellus]|nr:hypothetical protein BDR06DRAFT_975130 [Suillus hirtellus]